VPHFLRWSGRGVPLLVLVLVGCFASPAYAQQSPAPDPPDPGFALIEASLTPDGAQVTAHGGSAASAVDSHGRTTTGHAVAMPDTALAINPATCGLFMAGDVQHCQCFTAASTPLIVDYGVCEAQPATPGKPLPPAEAAVLAAVKEASASLKLPNGVPVVSPDPANNEWNMIPIGYPIWLTTTAPETVSVSATQDGITITITATRGQTAFNSGESPGKVIPYVYCWSMTQRKVHEYPPNKKSPDCGYVYKNMGTYTITATTTWHLSWSAAGYSGTMDTTRTAEAAKPLVIGQLKSRIVAVGVPTGGIG